MSTARRRTMATKGFKWDAGLLNGLVSLFEFNQSGEDEISGKHLTNSYFSWVPGKMKYAAGTTVNGAYFYNATGFNLQSFSLSYWFKIYIPATSSDNMFFMANGVIKSNSMSNTNLYTLGYGLSLNHNYMDDGGTWMQVSSGLTSTYNNVWNHFAISFDSVTNTIVAYSNGIAVIPSAITNNGINGFKLSPFYIGGISTSTGTNFFTGSIEQLAIWGRAISSAEMLQIYNGGSGLVFK